MSDSTSQQSDQQTYTDNRMVLGQDAMAATSGGTIVNYALDNGAINKALDTVSGVAGQAFGFSQATTGQALQMVSSGVGKVLDQAATDQQLIAAAYNDAKGQGALTQKILICAVVGALLVALAAVKHG